MLRSLRYATAAQAWLWARRLSFCAGALYRWPVLHAATRRHAPEDSPAVPANWCGRSARACAHPIRPQRRGPADWGISGGAFQRLIDKVTGQRPFRFMRPTSVAARGTALYVADPGAQALVILDPGEGQERMVARMGQENWCRRSPWR